MEKKKIGSLLTDAGNAAKDAIDKAKEKTILIADQNDDGKLNIEDVYIAAGAVADIVKKNAQAVMETAEEKSKLYELKTLRPIFTESLDAAEFVLPKLIRITERDKKHAESEVCKGSIGYLSDNKGINVVNIFRDSLKAFDLSFFPHTDSEFYYIDPSDRDQYIAMNEYFGHLKLLRINELQRVAQELGAKHFRVTYKEEQAASYDKKVNANAKVKKNGIDVKHSAKEKQYSTVEIAAEMEFPGHEPIRPTLNYMKRDPSVQNLIEMRMNKSSPLLHQRYMLKLSNSSGISENDAAKIDAAIKGIKGSANINVANEVKNEARKYLEYEIDF